MGSLLNSSAHCLTVSAEMEETHRSKGRSRAFMLALTSLPMPGKKRQTALSIDEAMLVLTVTGLQSDLWLKLQYLECLSLKLQHVA